MLTKMPKSFSFNIFVQKMKKVYRNKFTNSKKQMRALCSKSKSLFFFKSINENLKMDIYKCPFFKNLK